MRETDGSPQARGRTLTSGKAEFANVLQWETTASSPTTPRSTSFLTRNR